MDVELDLGATLNINIILTQLDRTFIINGKNLLSRSGALRDSELLGVGFLF